jgi:polysaccharide biosynthesis/export protein
MRKFIYNSGLPQSWTYISSWRRNPDIGIIMKMLIARYKVIFLQTALTVLLMLLLVLSGCSSNSKDITAFAKPGEVDTTAKNYVLEPPDEVEIRCSKVPEIHMYRQRIRPDGKISFEGLGEIQAAGKTPTELTALLYERITSLYKLPEPNSIGVGIVAYQSKFYYVLGEVERPGPKIFTGRDSVLTAIASANPMPTALNKNIRVIRPSSDINTKPKIFKLNYKKMMAKGDTSKDVLLQEGDIIYIPPTALASVGKTVQELMTPINSTFSTINVIQRTMVGPSGTQTGP